MEKRGVYLQQLEEVCPKCTNDRVLECKECQGTGRWDVGYIEESDCSVCRGKGWIYCPVCH